MSSSYPVTYREKADLYINALHEIRTRLRAIDAIMAGSMADLIRSESCFLQLRLSCECLALACLTAQGDFKNRGAFKNEYSPVRIFRALDDLYPEFFPTPSKMIRTGENEVYFDDIGAGHTISRADVEHLWERSGDHLHRASMKKYLKRTNETDFLSITRFKERFWNLITGHMIQIDDGDVRLFSSMNREDDHLECSFLHLNKSAGTAFVEPYSLALKNNLAV